MTPDVPPAEILPFPERPEDRLRRSMRALDAALAEQRQAVAGLRAELASLSGVLSGLEGSLKDCHTALDQAAEEVAEAGAQSRWLDATADAMLALARR